MQMKFQNRKIYKEARVEMLKDYWQQVLKWFVHEGVESNDAEIQQVGCNIMMVPKTVQDFVIR